MRRSPQMKFRTFSFIKSFSEANFPFWLPFYADILHFLLFLQQPTLSFLTKAFQLGGWMHKPSSQLNWQSRLKIPFLLSRHKNGSIGHKLRKKLSSINSRRTHASTENETMWEWLRLMPRSINLRDCIFIFLKHWKLTRQTRDKKCVAFLNHHQSIQRESGECNIIERENVISLFKCSLENLCLFISLHGFMYLQRPNMCSEAFQTSDEGEKFYFGFVIFYARFCAVEASGNASERLTQESEKYDSFLVGKRILLVAWSE